MKADVKSEGTQVVSSPVGPGWLLRCPECRRWFAMRRQGLLENPEASPEQGAHHYERGVVRYVCKNCAYVFEVAGETDPDCLP